MSLEKIKKDKENTIGRNIRKIRMERGMRQTDLVNGLQLLDIDITRESLVKIERGIQHIQLEQLRGIKTVLNTSYDEILSGSEYD